jgi:RNA polymerase sigma-70 factor (ECF subfamily)
MTQQQLKIQQNLLAQAHEEYRKQLKRYSLSKVSKPELAEDLVQDTFLRAWNYLLKGGKVETMKSFLYQILHRLIIDEYRRGKKTSSLDDLVEKGFEPSRETEEFEHLTDEIDGRALVVLIKKLPDRYRKVLTMRYVNNLSIEEMAAKVGQSKNTVAVQIHRGLVKLKEVFDEYNKKCEANHEARLHELDEKPEERVEQKSVQSGVQNVFGELAFG